ncbi:SH3 domain-containing protein [Jiella marina]|uniref:SH3 domain-containing protein n=1 Tax=Jiella sp. LLJ827 TaxID=2917712 RepID=UPI0021015A1E|nr:SH3 domain-containing protein [Jiella sp. LLJ827]MCQ0987221.1 SH3 domain-containing protein [Jiella sp. LLJ827]
MKPTAKLDYAFFRLSLILAALLLIASWYAPRPAASAEFVVRPDLVPHVLSLKRVFPDRFRTGPGALAREEGGGFDKLDLWPLSKGLGVIRLEGEITEGDAERLKALIDWNSPTKADIQGEVVISLNSPGGNFAEAFRLSGVLHEILDGNAGGIAGIVVLAGDRCLSACAILFTDAADTAHRGNEIRYVEMGAEVGFHMPFFAPGTASSDIDREAVLELGYDVAAAMVSLLSEQANPSELLERVLLYRGPESLFRLTGHLETWRMGFAPVAPADRVRHIGAAGLDTIAIGRLCNLSLTAGPAELGSWEDDFCDFQLGANPYDPKAAPGGVLLSELMQSGAKAFSASCEGFTCQAQVGENDRIGIAVWRGDGACGTTNDPRPASMCPASPVAVDTVSNGLFGEAYLCRDDKLLPGAFSEKHRPVIKRDVNMRDAPGRDGRVLTTLRARTGVEVTGCRLTPDDQGVWYQVQTARNSGWVSARFVGGHAERFRHRGETFTNDLYQMRRKRYEPR